MWWSGGRVNASRKSRSLLVVGLSLATFFVLSLISLPVVLACTIDNDCAAHERCVGGTCRDRTCSYSPWSGGQGRHMCCDEVGPNPGTYNYCSDTSIGAGTCSFDPDPGYQPGGGFVDCSDVAAITGSGSVDVMAELSNYIGSPSQCRRTSSHQPALNACACGGSCAGCGAVINGANPFLIDITCTLDCDGLGLGASCSGPADDGGTLWCARNDHLGNPLAPRICCQIGYVLDGAGGCIEPTTCFDPLAPGSLACNFFRAQPGYIGDSGCASGNQCCANFGDTDNDGVDEYYYQNTNDLGVSGGTITGVDVCGVSYTCGNNGDGVCPEDFSSRNCASCDTDCGFCGPVCGNGNPEAGEQCDDGNLINGDGCDSSCNWECDNGALDAGEQCDGANHNGQTCITQGFDAGPLGCFSQGHPSECQFDTSACVTYSCGNGVQEGTEQCDWPDLNGASCGSLGLGVGPLGCYAPGHALECQYDVSACTVPPTCGDSNIDAGETCDSGNLGGATCSNQGFDSGAIGCFPTGHATECQLDTSGCFLCGNTIPEPLNGEACDDGNLINGDGCDQFCQIEVVPCGNALIDAGEQCDGANLNGQTCQLLGWDAGGLACNPAGGALECTFDQSGCFNYVCGNNLIEGAEICDGTDLAGQTCASLGFGGGPLGCHPAGSGLDCTFDTSACIAPPVCGDSNVDPGEQCDTLNLNGETCATQGFAGGALNCFVSGSPSECQFDTSGCFASVCGDSIVQAPPEQCDTLNMNGETCLSLGFTAGGSLGCFPAGSGSECLYDTSGCSMIPVCGNGVPEAGELCDDGNLLPGDGCDGSCKTEVCGDTFIDWGETCDDGNLINGDGCDSSCQVETACTPGACQGIGYETGGVCSVVAPTGNTAWTAEPGFTCGVGTCYCANCGPGAAWDPVGATCIETACNDNIDNDDDGTCDFGGCLGLPLDTDCNAGNNPPGAVFSGVPTSGAQPLSVFFEMNITDETTGVNYQLDYGDGSPPYSAVGGPVITDTDTYVYGTAGTFTATLTATDNIGQAAAPQNVVITVSCNAGSPAGSPAPGGAGECCNTACYFGGSCYSAGGGPAVCVDQALSYQGQLCDDSVSPAVWRDRDESVLYTAGTVTCNAVDWMAAGDWCEGLVGNTTSTRCDTFDAAGQYACGDDANEVYSSTFWGNACLNGPGCYGQNSGGQDRHYSGVEICADLNDDNDCDGLFPANDPDCFVPVSGRVLLNTSTGTITNGYFSDIWTNVGGHTAKADANGDYSLLLPIGNYDIYATFSGAVTGFISVNVGAGGALVNQNILLQELQCNSDCTNQGGYCDTQCIGKNGCLMGVPQADPRMTTMNACAPPGNIGKQFGELVFLNQNATHREVGVCCSAAPQWEPAPTAQITGTMENLIKYTRLINYQGKQVRLVIASYN